jgi:hypothetical protein
MRVFIFYFPKQRLSSAFWSNSDSSCAFKRLRRITGLSWLPLFQLLSIKHQRPSSLLFPKSFTLQPISVSHLTSSSCLLDLLTPFCPNNTLSKIVPHFFVSLSLFKSSQVSLDDPPQSFSFIPYFKSILKFKFESFIQLLSVFDTHLWTNYTINYLRTKIISYIFESMKAQGTKQALL